MKQDTRLVTAGRKPEENFGIVNPPVYHASTVIFPSIAALEESARTPFQGVRYGRYGTPTTFALEEAVADLDGADRAVAVCSGLSAITVALLAYAKAGDHILVTDSVYGPTRSFCDGMLAALGVETEYYDPLIGSGIARLIRPHTRLVYLESPGSLTFEVQDVPAICAASRARGVKTVIDSTWASGLFFKPFEHGADVAVYAATKYIVGHSDAMLGVLTMREAEHPAIKGTAAALGIAAGPDDMYLGLRGLRTIGVRMRRHQETGLALARWLQDRPEVRRVIHPALPQDPGHSLWKRDFTGACGLFGVVLEPVPKPAADAFVDALSLFGLGYSWGGFESLVVPSNPHGTRSAVPWTEEGPLIRLHAGLEDPEDLVADLERGFAALARTR